VIDRPVEVVRIEPSDGRAFDEWFDVLVETDRPRWPEGPGWQRVERLAMALDDDGPVEHQCLVARRGSRVVGIADLEMYRRENPHAARLDVRVRPEHRRRGIGSALVSEAERIARQSGRTEIGGLDETPLRTDYVDTAAPFARRLGFEPAQRMVCRRLDLPLDRAHEDALRRNPKSSPEGYTLLTFADRWPDADIVDRCALGRRMSTDVPLGGQVLEEETWDEGRVRDLEGALAAQNRAKVITAARHTATGRLVAYTELVVPLGAPECAWQHDTLVMREHRGRGLGFAIKVANLFAVAERHPAVRWVNTTNAQENGPMIAVNEEMGFEVVAHSVLWLREVAAAGPAPSRPSSA
jgi:GNAT superfamily N-acetyltransferase